MRFKRLFCVLLLLSCLATSFANAPGFGRARSTLIGRWQADLIAYVEVIEEKVVDGEQVNRLKILSVIKSDGHPDMTQVQAHIQLGSHWPYTFGRTRKAIAFLDFDEEDKRYVDFYADAGIDVDEPTGKLFVSQYAKLAKILKEKNKGKRLQKQVDWYFGFVANPSTREQAAYGIKVLWKQAGKNKLLAKDQLASESSLLSLIQKQKICELLANEEPTMDSYSLIQMCSDHPSEDIDDYLLKSLNQSLKNVDQVPFNGTRISDLAIELLPKRRKFVVPPDLKQKLEAYHERRIDYAYEISIEDKYSKADRKNAKASLIDQWRKLAKEFLEAGGLRAVE